MSQWLNGSMRLLAAGAVLLSGVTFAAAPAKSAPAAHVPQHHITVNPHLHLKPTTAKPGKPDVKTDAAKHAGGTKTTTTTVTHRHRTGWHYTEWAAVHRGTGTIVGRVVGKNGQLVRGASLVLRKPNGKGFRRAAAKHVVSTNAEGRFVMRNVRLGSYRVRAHQGKPSGHANVRVHGGQVAAVQIQI